MLMQPATTPRFDPELWLSAFAKIGGSYALMVDRRLAFLVERCYDEPLTSVMAQIVGHPDKQEAIKAVIERRQNGEPHECVDPIPG